MWLYTNIGFFSIVQKDGAGTLTIRSRVRKDLENLRLRMGAIDQDMEIIESVDSDYRYRIVVDKKEASLLLMLLVQSIDYDNFKDHVHTKDPLRADIYSGIWVHTLRLEALDGDDE